MGRPLIRPLSQGEAALAREVFGQDLWLHDIRFMGSPWPFNRAFVPGRWFARDWIVWPRATLLPDMSRASLKTQGIFIHELVHVWQAQNGINLLTAKLRAGDGPGAYAYPVDDRCQWRALNIEQQAMVVEHRFLQSRGADVPADRAFYRRVCPIGA